MTCKEVLALIDFGGRPGLSDTEIIVIGCHLEGCKKCRRIVRRTKAKLSNRPSEAVVKRLLFRMNNDPELQYLSN